MYRLADIVVAIVVFTGIAINVALPPEIDFCDQGISSVTSQSVVSNRPANSALYQQHRNSGPVANPCRLQLPFASAILVANIVVGGHQAPTDRWPRGKNRTVNDRMPSPLTGPPRLLS